MPRYFRVVYHQKWTRTHDLSQTTNAHSIATHVLGAGADLAFVKDWLGHTKSCYLGCETCQIRP